MKEKIVFIGGPRQVGKTTLARSIGTDHYRNPTYYNWDSRDNRKEMLQSRFLANAELVVFDELHMFHQWKNYVKRV